MTIRFAIQPRMVPPDKIARRLGVTRATFAEKRAALEANGFPKPDPVLGNYCLQAVDNWIDARAGLQPAHVPVSDPATVLQMAGSKAWRK
ncbi:MAG: hypothetical protein ACXIVF_15675 [Rhizobiaceae bacterium]